MISKIKNIAHGYYSFFLDIFFPKRCVGCGQADTILCYSCSKEIENIVTPVCGLCGRINQYGQFCPSCRRRANTKLKGIIAAAIYDKGPLKEMIHHLKYTGYKSFAEDLGHLLFLRLNNKIPSGKILVVPVPLYHKKESERGFNQAELVAEYFSKKLKLSGACVLQRTKETETQVKLDRAGRLKNLKGAFACRDNKTVEGKTILLVDDVTTTGATLNECAQVLLDSGAKSVWGVVVAKRMS